MEEGSQGKAKRLGKLVVILFIALIIACVIAIIALILTATAMYWNNNPDAFANSAKNDAAKGKKIGSMA